MKQGWDIPVILQHDELLSSWLVRIALANGCDPLVVSWCIWDKWRAWANDIDRNPGENRLITLSKFSRQNLSDLNRAILFPVASSILGRVPSSNELWPWLLTTGTRNRLRRGGIQYCVECLKKDKKPYLRREWRYAWHIQCSKHSEPLQDSCPHCHAPIEPHRLVAEDQVITKCASCHLSLLDNTSQQPINTDAVLFQKWADEVIFNQQEPIVHGMSVTVQSWFETARYYESFVRRCILAPNPALKQFSELLNLKLEENIQSGMALIAFEQMNIDARSALLGLIFNLMKLTQADLIQKLNEASITKQGFCSAKIQLPANLMEIAACLPEAERGKRKPSVKKQLEPGLPKPRPHWEVNRMWRQLLQKMQEKPGF